jgi:hypothetical protein
MEFVYDDGGREAAGFRGKAGDCVARAVAIASGKPYAEVYAALADGMGKQRKSKGRSARNGVSTKRKWFKDYMQALGFSWTPTMQIGQGCKVHLDAGELPSGRLVVAVSRHYVAVIDGVLRDTFDARRFAFDGLADFEKDEGVGARPSRCVYGYWARA